MKHFKIKIIRIQFLAAKDPKQSKEWEIMPLKILKKTETDFQVVRKSSELNPPLCTYHFRQNFQNLGCNSCLWTSNDSGGAFIAIRCISKISNFFEQRKCWKQTLISKIDPTLFEKSWTTFLRGLLRNSISFQSHVTLWADFSWWLFDSFTGWIINTFTHLAGRFSKMQA